MFVVGFVSIGALRADYDPMRQFVSLLSLTADGWQQVVNFLVTGVLVVGGALGLRRVMTNGPGSTWVPILIGLAGIGIIVAGASATDPAQGYPPGTPPGLPSTYSLSGTILSWRRRSSSSAYPLRPSSWPDASAAMAAAGRSIAGFPAWGSWRSSSVHSGFRTPRGCCSASPSCSPTDGSLG